ncbi:MAG TPA: terminase, partial [Anaerolineae bacterium]|nr:terminase [Anaerolineae bacterium]
ANPWAAQAEAGNVKIVRGDWDIDAFLNECERFPEGAHDDQVDAVSGAISMLARSGPSWAFV